jgi:ATP-dependent exoDNAse (exonuclease V) alpha subunit
MLKLKTMPIAKVDKLQREFLDLTVEGRNIFLTGKAGTGKSYTLRNMIQELSLSHEIVVLGTTGVAAYNVGGQTIHSMFNLPIHGMMTKESCRRLTGKNKRVLKDADIIVVDEVSMMRPDMLDAMHFTLIKNGVKQGLLDKQLILVGDLKQLPPAVDNQTMGMLVEFYEGVNFSDANIFPKLNFETIELEYIYRQSDPKFIEALNVVRDGGKSEYFKRFISDTPKGLILAPHNSTVNKYNSLGLKSLSSKELTYSATITGKAKPNDFTLEENLTLKDGCKIMYLINTPEDKLHNGSLGVFRLVRGNPCIDVDGVLVRLTRTTLSKKEYYVNPKTAKIEMQTVGTFIQYPVKLAYALTIHKSQGLTFDELTLDLTRLCFESGQLYTGLSRVRSPEGLRIIVK